MHINSYVIGVATASSTNGQLLTNAGANCVWNRPPPGLAVMKEGIQSALRSSTKEDLITQLDDYSTKSNNIEDIYTITAV